MSIELASAAVGALVPYLSAAGEKAAQALGAEAATELRALWDWVKGKVAGGTTEALAATPADAKAQGKLEGALEQVLEDEPALADELRRLVEAAEPEATRLEQTMNIQGDDNVAVQNTGHGNTYNINKG
ncbi:MAG: hypothetical protein GVY33_10195 [Alphaproteobacteria bacterium]|jgi:phage repressor protein C with HTH and peptisase S24 domain|nr:hypothetical protein [Alphaproteobacteria bacterium]